MKIKKVILFLLDKIIAPVIVGILIAVLTGTISAAYLGNFIILFYWITPIGWIIIGSIFSAWILIIFIRNRIKRLKQLNSGPLIYASHTPIFGCVVIGELNYVGAKWQILAPASAPWDKFSLASISPSLIEVKTPPRCPQCGTEIEESKNFWYGYVWKCVNCDWTIRNKHSFYNEVKRAEKIARRQWEKELESRSQHH